LCSVGIDHSPLQEDQRRNWVNTQAPWSIIYRDYRSFAHEIEVPSGFFFRISQVRVGGTMKVSLPAEVVPAILPRAVAEKLPFNNLADVLSLFNITPSSPAAAKINDTLSRCQAPDPAGEKKACATSLEGTVKTAVRMLLSTTSRPVWAVASKGLRANGRLPLQPYVIEAIRPLDGNRHVGCHVVTYPYAVYHCHTTGQPTKAYVVTLRGLREHGLGVQLAAICHLNTSTWNPAYPAFQMVHTRPGGVPVCHFMRIANLVFGEKAAKA
jgi:hypothetical protein